MLCCIAVSKAVEITPNTVYRFKNHKGQYLTVSNGETYHPYTLRLNVSCSGLYKITVRSVIDAYVIFDNENKVPSFLGEIYPNVNILFENETGLNIEGYTFLRNDEEHDKTIYLPRDFIANNSLKSCVVYIPGLFFADTFTVVNTTGQNASEYSLHKTKQMVSPVEVNSGASKYYATVDLSNLKNKEESSSPEKLNVSISKNGVSSNFTFNVGVGENGNVATQVETIESIDEKPIYFNLQGIEIHNPAKDCC